MDEPEVVREDWEVLLLARKVFGEQQKERPWIRHQQIEPTIKIHMAEPRADGDEPPKCMCGDIIPPAVMQKYYWLKGVCEGKRAGEPVMEAK